MATSSHSSSMYLLAGFLLNFYFQGMAAEPNMAFFFKNFGKDSNFESQLALYGDAMVANDSVSIQIAGKAGRIIYKKPFNFTELISGNLVSFSSNFVFSLSKEKGDGLAFVMLPFGFPLNVFDGGSMEMLEKKKMKFVAIEFDTFRDDKYSDVNGNHVGLDVDSLVSVKVSNVSSINLELSSGEKLQAWIDYVASSKRLEVRLHKLGDNKPVDPLLSHSVDMSTMWRNESVAIGLSSLGRNSSQKCNVYSWRFRPRIIPHWMHSKPMDPEEVMGQGEEMKVSKRSGVSLRILAALILGTGCGALGAIFVLFVWTIFVDRQPVMPEEVAGQSEELESKKCNVSVAKTSQDGKE